MYWIFQQFHQNFPNFLWWKLTKIRLFWYPVQLTEACKITLGGAEDKHFPLFQSLCQIGLKNNPQFIQTNPGDISNIIKSKHLKSILILFWEKNCSLCCLFLPSKSHCYFTRLNLKNGVTLILPPSIARNSSAPNAKIFFEILWGILEGQTNSVWPSQPCLKNCQKGTF